MLRRVWNEKSTHMMSTGVGFGW